MRVGKDHQLRLCLRQGRMQIVQPCHHPLHVAIEDGMGQIERDRGNGGGGIGADSGEFEQRCVIGRKNTVMLGHYGARAFQKVARPRVVAKARPFPHHIRILCRRQITHRGPARDEASEILTDRGNCGLLQHDLAHPDRVGIGLHASLARLWRHAPRHLTGVCVVPRQQGYRHVIIVTHSL